MSAILRGESWKSRFASHEVFVRGFRRVRRGLCSMTSRVASTAHLRRLARSDKHGQREVIKPWHEPLPLNLLDNALPQSHRQRQNESEDRACDDE